MANSLKKKTPPPPDPEVLNADKETDISVTEVVKDERTGKIAGAISLLTAIFLFIAFTSYLFTCLLYTSPSPRDRTRSRMPSSA